MPKKLPIALRGGTTAQWTARDVVLDVREPGVNIDTGSFKIGDGTSKWSELPDYRNGKFSKVITVSKDDKFADFNCADAVYGGSDAACIQAAIDYCATHSIIELWIFDGTYIISTQIIGSSDINIRGFGDVILQSNSLSNDIIRLSGSVLKTVTGSDVIAGATSITVSDTTGISAGFLVLITDNVIWGDGADYPNLKTGEMHDILSVSGSTINFVDGLLHNYTSDADLTAVVITPIKINIENVTFRGTSDTASKGHISLTYVKDSTITNCNFDKGGLRSIEFDNSYMCTVKECKISNCLDANYGYGIVVNDASAHIEVYTNKIDNCRHAFASGGYQVKGQPRDLSVFQNELSGSTISHVVDAHPGVESISVYSNTIHCNGRYAFSSGAAWSSFGNNKVYDGFGASIRGSTKNIYYSVENNEFYRCGYAFDTYMTTCSQKKVSIKNNKMYVSLYYIALINNCETIEISGNSIDKTTIEYGLYLKNITNGIVSSNFIQNPHRSAVRLYNCANLIISNNVFENCNTAGLTGLSYESGISLELCTNNKINGNVIRDSAGKMRYAVREYTGSNNNLINNNFFSGSTVKNVDTLGSATIVQNNIGHKTENTGSATLLLNTTSVTVSHGLAATPTRVQLTPTFSTQGISYYVPTASRTATTFDIVMLSAPTADVTFDWRAEA